MLNPAAVTEGLQLANALAAQGRVAVPVPLTPVESVVKANLTGDLVIAMNDTEDASVFAALMLNASKVTTRDGAPEHELAQVDFVEKGAAVAAVNLDLGKNVVVPKVLDIINRTMELAQMNASRSLNNIAVVPAHYSTIYSNPNVLALVEPFAEVAFEDYQPRAVLTRMPTLEEATAWMTTGSSAIDADVLELLKRNPNLPLQAVDGMFINYSHALKPFNVQVNPYHADEDRLVAIFLIARRLLSDIPDFAALSLNDHRSVLASILSQSAAGINGIIRIRERSSTLNTLIRSFPSADASATVGNGNEIIIYVNGDVYSRWLNDGGTPETIMGSFISDRETGYQALIDKKSTYETTWNQHLKIRSAYISEERFNRTAFALRTVLVAAIDAHDEPTLSKEILRNRMVELLSDFSVRHLDQFSGYIRDIVCKLFFAHTNVLMLLREMDGIKAANPEMPMDEVATLAVVEFIAEWFSVQMTAEVLV